MQYTIADLTSYRAWYDVTPWDSVGDPTITEELVTNEIGDTGRERRGNHEVLTLQGWDGKTYINLK